VELSNENISSSAKKLKTDRETSVPEDPNIGYRILNFLTVFSVLSECIKCKKCDSDVRFSIESTRGLGFKIVVSCSSCKPTFIPSCSYIKTAYEINTRFFFVMRLLGIGLRGAMKFCGLIDLPPTVQQTTYDMIIDNIHSAASSIVQLVLKQAVKEEQQEITKQNSSDDINAKSYGDEIEIIKKECVGHVQKRMGTRLRECKKKNSGIGGKNKLTAKFVDKLSIYYGLAIRRNSNSKDDMKKAI
ncbi:hypothetical protein ALC60_11123, partial [Trachymyrmex zeteki]